MLFSLIIDLSSYIYIYNVILDRVILDVRRKGFHVENVFRVFKERVDWLRS